MRATSCSSLRQRLAFIDKNSGVRPRRHFHPSKALLNFPCNTADRKKLMGNSGFSSILEPRTPRSFLINERETAWRKMSTASRIRSAARSEIKRFMK